MRKCLGCQRQRADDCHSGRSVDTNIAKVAKVLETFESNIQSANLKVPRLDCTVYV